MPKNAKNNIGAPSSTSRVVEQPAASEIFHHVEVSSCSRRIKACPQIMWSVPRAKAAPGELDHQCRRLALELPKTTTSTMCMESLTSAIPLKIPSSSWPLISCRSAMPATAMLQAIDSSQELQQHDAVMVAKCVGERPSVQT